MRWRGVLVNASVSVVSVAVTLLVGEVALRMLGLRGEVSMAVTDVVPVNDPVLDFRLRPRSVSFSGDVAYEINGKGFRDLDRPYEKPAGVRRVVVIGDSIAFGYKVKLEDTFSRVLERLLAKDNAGGGEVQVVTLAFPGLNTIQESRLLLEEGAKYDPDAIVIAYSLNDAEAGISARGRDKPCRIELIRLPIPCGAKTVLKHSALLYFVKDRLDHLAWRFGLGDDDDVFGSLRSDHFGQLYAKDTLWRANAAAGLERVAEFARARRLPVTVVIFPILFQLDEYRWGWIHDKVAAKAREMDMDVVDLRDEYRKHPVVETRVERGDFVHPGRVGHRVAAEAVVPVVRQRLAGGKPTGDTRRILSEERR